MKHSIKKIFTNLSIFLLTLTTIMTIVTLLVVEQNSSYAGINNLKNQKKIINDLSNLKKDDIQLALILFNGKSTQLHHEINKLRNLNKYDYTGKYFLGNSDEYLSDLNKLSKLTTIFNSSAHNYYIKNLENKEEYYVMVMNSSGVSRAFGILNTSNNRIETIKIGSIYYYS